MNWWEWVFSGVGVFGLGLLVTWLSRRSRSGQETAITAQGGKVSDSPVTTGSGNTQLVNSPTNIYLPYPQPIPPQPITRSESSPKPVKRLMTGLVRVVPVDMGQNDKFYVDNVAGKASVLVQFTNEPDATGQSVRVTAKARVVFCDDGGKELCRINDGCWFDERLNTKTFDYDESHELMLATVHEGQLLAFKNVRTEEQYLAEQDEGADCIPVEGFTPEVLVDVRLTDKYSGVVLNHSKFVLSVEPLQAKPQTA
jgi:hypothetical protein